MAEPQSLDIPCYPKITPYRLTVLATTIGLGTTKAILAQMGSTFMPTTLEWLKESRRFFLVSPCDCGGDDSPKYLAWLFEPDLMDLIWYLLAITFSITRPDYSSGERVIPYTWRLPITTYRILVSSSVMAFGISKATFGYLGVSTAATWTDWALGVVATSLFYCLGLCETNSSVYPSFFVHDQRPYLSSVRTATLYTGGIAGSTLWVLYWTNILRRIWPYSTTSPSKPDSRHPIIEEAVSQAFNCFIIEFVVLAIAFGVAGLAVILRLVVISVSGTGLFNAIRGRIFGTLLPSFSGDQPSLFPAFMQSRYVRWIKTFLRLCIHVTLHFCAFTACLSISVLVTGIVTFLYDTINGVDSVLIMVGFGIPAIPASLLALVLYLTDCAIVISLISPLFMYYDSSRFPGTLISPW
ncbi:hypothetical protein GALMADRAFT_144015 [Galerina marginata CBS 339.88]|uniref:Uncharacterized protein n=1 Tax=Galerina marginata (strain CBS 339.88) TaxID=685588 RepID=A0A067SK99_GALM3|nr:hypothetical protein GALMADRAFT_144015 [Galerina marginata CBS 339.88]